LTLVPATNPTCPEFRTAALPLVIPGNRDLVVTGLDPQLSGRVMAARVVAIHVFGAVSKVVDGWAEPSHDGRKVPGRQHDEMHDAARGP
jgi:hypothetical protein